MVKIDLDKVVRELLKDLEYLDELLRKTKKDKLDIALIYDICSALIGNATALKIGVRHLKKEERLVVIEDKDL